MARNPIQNNICKQSVFTRPIDFNADSLLFNEAVQIHDKIYIFSSWFWFLSSETEMIKKCWFYA